MSEAMVTMNIRIEESQRDEIDREMVEANKLISSFLLSIDELCGGGEASVWRSRSQFLRWVIDVGLESIRNQRGVSDYLARRSPGDLGGALRHRRRNKSDV
jgi:hypothetical protein